MWPVTALMLNPNSEEALPGLILTSDMTQKVATERKMKLRQETTSLGQIVTVTAKLRISDKEQCFGLFITRLNAKKK